MRWLTALFVLAVLLGLAIELWLGARQAAAVARHRERVPGPFAASVSPAEHAKAADYTLARLRLGRLGSLIDAALTLALTVGGGIAAVDALWRHGRLSEPWLGLAVIASVALLVQLIHLPLSVWDLRARGALWLQPHHTRAVPRRPRQGPRARRGARRSGAHRDTAADGARGTVVVGVGMGAVARGHAAHDLGLAGVHRTALQPLRAASGPGAAGADRSAARSLRLRRTRSLRRRQLASLDPRQRLLHGHRPPQAHRVLRYAPRAARAPRSRGGARARARSFPTPARASAAAALGRAGLRGTGAARVAHPGAGLLRGARRAGAVNARGAAALCLRGAGFHLLRHSARLALVASPRVRGGRFREPPRERRRARERARQAPSRQRQHADAGCALRRVLLFAPAAARAHHAAARPGRAAGLLKD